MTRVKVDKIQFSRKFVQPYILKLLNDINNITIRFYPLLSVPFRLRYLELIEVRIIHLIGWFTPIKIFLALLRPRINKIKF
jgi:hypothetical protein